MDSKKNLSRPGVYAIKNRVNGKTYVGSSMNIYGRWSVHLSMLRNGKHDSAVLQRAWNKYGEDAFEWSVLEFCEPEVVYQREMDWIGQLRSGVNDNGYNIRRLVHSNSGLHHTDETKAKLSAIKKGTKQSRESVERRAAMLRGRKLSDEVLRRRKTRKGVLHSDDVRQKVARNRSTISDETIAEIKLLLEQGELTQIEIAERFGIHQGTVSRIKAGKLVRMGHGNNPDNHAT